MSLSRTHAMVDILDAIGFESRDLFLRRQALVMQAGVDEATVIATVGTMQVHPMCFHAGRFDIAIEGIEPEPAVIIGALDHQERLMDFVAWPVDRPTEMATLFGHVSMLGERQAWTPPFAGTPLRVHRTARAWVLAGFDGCVPLDHFEAARTFLEIGADLIVEDDRHGAELDQARRALMTNAFRILVREAA